MYKVGNVITTKTFNGDVHLNVVIDIYNVKDKDLGETVLYCQGLYDERIKPLEDYRFSIILPEQEDSILPKEQYFQEIQSKIDEQQYMLNFIKEKYDTTNN